MKSRPVPPFFIVAFLVPRSPAAEAAGRTSARAIARAVDEAQVGFRQLQATGQDLSAGPCISESLPGLADWVADIAHDPRQSVDDQPANQCQRYRSGEAHHFVELAPDGN